MARRNDNPAVIEALLQAGADPRARPFMKWTPLHIAVSGSGTDNPAVIEALLQAGANLEAQDDSKETPLHFLGQVHRESSGNRGTAPGRCGSGGAE